MGIGQLQFRGPGAEQMPGRDLRACRTVEGKAVFLRNSWKLERP